MASLPTDNDDYIISDQPSPSEASLVGSDTPPPPPPLTITAEAEASPQMSSVVRSGEASERMENDKADDTEKERGEGEGGGGDEGEETAVREHESDVEEGEGEGEDGTGDVPPFGVSSEAAVHEASEEGEGTQHTVASPTKKNDFILEFDASEFKKPKKKKVLKKKTVVPTSTFPSSSRPASASAGDAKGTNINTNAGSRPLSRQGSTLGVSAAATAAKRSSAAPTPLSSPLTTGIQVPCASSARPISGGGLVKGGGPSSSAPSRKIGSRRNSTASSTSSLSSVQPVVAGGGVAVGAAAKKKRLKKSTAACASTDADEETKKESTRDDGEAPEELRGDGVAAENEERGEEEGTEEGQGSSLVPSSVPSPCTMGLPPSSSPSTPTPPPPTSTSTSSGGKASGKGGRKTRDEMAMEAATMKVVNRQKGVEPPAPPAPAAPAEGREEERANKDGSSASGLPQLTEADLDCNWVYNPPPNNQRTLLFAEDWPPPSWAVAGGRAGLGAVSGRGGPATEDPTFPVVYEGKFIVLSFSSEFDSGNLIQVERTAPYTYNLHCCPDCGNSPQQTNNKQWFHFSVRGLPRGVSIKCTMVGVANSKMYTFGWVPVSSTVPLTADGRAFIVRANEAMVERGLVPAASSSAALPTPSDGICSGSGATTSTSTTSTGAACPSFYSYGAGSVQRMLLGAELIGDPVYPAAAASLQLRPKEGDDGAGAVVGAAPPSSGAFRADTYVNALAAGETPILYARVGVREARAVVTSVNDPILVPGYPSLVYKPVVNKFKKAATPAGDGDGDGAAKEGGDEDGGGDEEGEGACASTAEEAAAREAVERFKQQLVGMADATGEGGAIIPNEALVGKRAAASSSSSSPPLPPAPSPVTPPAATWAGAPLATCKKGGALSGGVTIVPLSPCRYEQQPAHVCGAGDDGAEHRTATTMTVTAADEDNAKDERGEGEDDNAEGVRVVNKERGEESIIKGGIRTHASTAIVGDRIASPATRNNAVFASNEDPSGEGAEEPESSSSGEEEVEETEERAHRRLKKEKTEGVEATALFAEEEAEGDMDTSERGDGTPAPAPAATDCDPIDGSNACTDDNGPSNTPSCSPTAPLLAKTICSGGGAKRKPSGIRISTAIGKANVQTSSASSSVAASSFGLKKGAAAAAAASGGSEKHPASYVISFDVSSEVDIPFVPTSDTERVALVIVMRRYLAGSKWRASAVPEGPSASPSSPLPSPTPTGEGAIQSVIAAAAVRPICPFPQGHPKTPALFIAGNHPYSFGRVCRHLLQWRAGCLQYNSGLRPPSRDAEAPGKVKATKEEEEMGKDKPAVLCPLSGEAVPMGGIYYNEETLCTSLDGHDVHLLTITGISEQTRVGDREGPIASVATGGSGAFNTCTNTKGGTNNKLKAGRILLPLSGNADGNARPLSFPDKKYIVVSARIHPGETPGAYMLHGLLDFVLHPSDPRALKLRQDCVVLVVPTINPDGVQRGHSRADTTGQNLNRCYRDPSFTKHPTPYCVKMLLLYLQRQGRLHLYLDLHAHANKKGTFAYGNSMASVPMVQNLLYAKLVAMSSPYFEFPSCNFSENNMFAVGKTGEGKDSSSRVTIYQDTGFVHSYTVEANYVAASALGPVIGLPSLPPDNHLATYTRGQVFVAPSALVSAASASLSAAAAQVALYTGTQPTNASAAAAASAATNTDATAAVGKRCAIASCVFVIGSNTPLPESADVPPTGAAVPTRYSPATHADVGRGLVLGFLELHGLLPQGYSRVSMSSFRTPKAVGQAIGRYLVADAVDAMRRQVMLRCGISHREFYASLKTPTAATPSGVSSGGGGAKTARLGLLPADLPSSYTVKGSRTFPPTTVFSLGDVAGRLVAEESSVCASASPSASASPPPLDIALWTYFSLSTSGDNALGHGFVAGAGAGAGASASPDIPSAGVTVCAGSSAATRVGGPRAATDTANHSQPISSSATCSSGPTCPLALCNSAAAATASGGKSSDKSAVVATPHQPPTPSVPPACAASAVGRRARGGSGAAVALPQPSLSLLGGSGGLGVGAELALVGVGATLHVGAQPPNAAKTDTQRSTTATSAALGSSKATNIAIGGRFPSPSSVAMATCIAPPPSTATLPSVVVGAKRLSRRGSGAVPSSSVSACAPPLISTALPSGLPNAVSDKSPLTATDEERGQGGGSGSMLTKKTEADKKKPAVHNSKHVVKTKGTAAPPPPSSSHTRNK